MSQIMVKKAGSNNTTTSLARIQILALTKLDEYYLSCPLKTAFGLVYTRCDVEFRYSK